MRSGDRNRKRERVISATWEEREQSEGSGRALAVRLQPVTLKEVLGRGGCAVCVPARRV